MTENQPMPSPAEMRVAEEAMTPLQKAMTKARFEIMSHKDDFVAAGVRIDELEVASVNAEKRVQQEFEKTPISRLEAVLTGISKLHTEDKPLQDHLNKMIDSLRITDEVVGNKIKDLMAEGKTREQALHDVFAQTAVPGFVIPGSIDVGFKGESAHLLDSVGVNLVNELLEQVSEVRYEDISRTGLTRNESPKIFPDWPVHYSERTRDVETNIPGITLYVYGESDKPLAMSSKLGVWVKLGPEAITK